MGDILEINMSRGHLNTQKCSGNSWDRAEISPGQRRKKKKTQVTSWVHLSYYLTVLVVESDIIIDTTPKLPQG